MDKKSKVSNYFILGALVLVTFIIAFYLLTWYRQYEDNKLSTPIITSVLREVKYDNLDTVIKERDFLVVYMCTSDEALCRNFEKKFKKYVTNKNLVDDIVYYNLNSDGGNKSIKEVYDRYKHKDLIKKVYDYPTLLVFSEGKIIDVLTSTKSNKINVSLVEEFLGDYEL